MSLKSKEITALLAVLALTGAGSVSAETPVYTLKGITVTANRQAERLQDVPANVQVVTEYSPGCGYGDRCIGIPVCGRYGQSERI